MTKPGYRDVLRILGLIDAARGTELEFEVAGLSVRVIPAAPGTGTPPAGATVREGQAAASPAAEAPPAAPRARAGRARPGPRQRAPAAARCPAPMPARSPRPWPAPSMPPRPRGAAPFVTVGDRVRKGAQLGIVEVMKLFTPDHRALRRPWSLSILVENQQVVARGETLMLLGEG
ncbi:MAG: hypothetical protein KatS3mg118_0013 [Paracoccaceae bacterium]|nr:MAG: hypothetical protein KatS3mg118_0013 [Paracoccaceae bacterium]